MFKKTTLKNGFRIITVPQKSTSAVTVLTLVGTGSKYENKKINGISHFLEHMFFKGTQSRPTAVDVIEPLDEVGGIYNAFTGEEYTGYFAKVDKNHLDLALDWVSDIYFNSLLPRKEIEKEKGVIVQEINMYQDHPMSHIGILWSKLLYGDQPAGWPIAGDKKTVSKISREKLVSYMKSQYVAKNTIVCVSGNIDSQKTTEKVKKYFSRIRSSEPLNKPKVFESQRKPECLLFEKNTDQAHVCLGVRAFNIFDPQKYAQELLAIILGGMMSSRLFVEIREKLGLAYYVNTSISADQDTGELVTQAGLHNQKLEQGIKAILKEYKKIRDRKVPSAELKKAKDHFKGKMALLLEASDARASFYGTQELLENKISTPEEVYKEIDKLSQSDVQKVSREIFRPEKLNLALIGPFKSKDRFQRLLKI